MFCVKQSNHLFLIVELVNGSNLCLYYVIPNAFKFIHHDAISKDVQYWSKEWFVCNALIPVQHRLLQECDHIQTKSTVNAIIHQPKTKIRIINYVISQI